MERVIFTGIGFHIDSISGTEVTYWLDSSPPQGPFTIDLARSPSQATQWRDIDVDDKNSDATGGATRVPLITGERAALAYVSEAYLQGHPAITFPPHGFEHYEPYRERRYEFMSVQYSASSTNGILANKRYYGFHGIWFAGPRKDALVALWHGGTSITAPTKAPTPPLVKMLDLDDPSQTHPTDRYLGHDVAFKTEGPVYISCDAAMNTNPKPLSIPKLPAVAGGLPITNCRRP